MVTYYTVHYDYYGDPLPDRNHLFENDATARKALLRWGALEAYRVLDDGTKVYIIRDWIAIPPTSFKTVIVETSHPEI